MSGSGFELSIEPPCPILVEAHVAAGAESKGEDLPKRPDPQHLPGQPHHCATPHRWPGPYATSPSGTADFGEHTCVRTDNARRHHPRVAGEKVKVTWRLMVITGYPSYSPGKSIDSRSGGFAERRTTP